MMPITTFSEANEYLSQYDNNIGHYNLSGVKELMEFLGNPQDQLKIVHIAGTSGKTSTAYFMTQFLVEEGQKVGLTVSPALDQVNERLQLNMKPLPETEYTSSLNKFINLLSNTNMSPSRFEFMMAFAYWYFAEAKVDYAVIEVGLGGLLDATNVISRPDKICLITDIGYDHMHILGDTLAKIAYQKAGIIQKHNVVFMYKQPEEVMVPIQERVDQFEASLHVLNNQIVSGETMPAYQERNWGLAYKALVFIQKRDELPILSEDQLETSKHFQVPGRMDIKRYKNKTIILDVAHNPQKMQAFISSFNKLYPGARPSVLVATGLKKDYQETAMPLKQLAGRVITTSFKKHGAPGSGSIPAAELALAFDGLDCISIEDPKEALEALIDSKEQVIVITGSLYLISQLRSDLEYLK
jgi:dihydrofolate synthase/folylpolyglutamate synthase